MRNPRQLLYHALVIAWKDLTEFRRSRIALAFSIIFPVMIIAMFGYMFPSTGMSVNNVAVGIVVEDASGQYATVAISMIRSAFANSSSFILVNVSTQSDAKAKIMSGEIKGAVVIPENFTASLLNNTRGQIILITDPSNPALSSAITQAFSGVIGAVSDYFASQIIAGGIHTDPQFVLQPVSASPVTVVPGGGSYFDYIAPGFIALTVMMSGLTGLGVALARERESGTLDGFLMCPISRVSIILGKTLSQTVRNLIQGAITITLAVLLFNVHIRGDIILIVFILVLGTLSFLGLGILATAVAREQESAQFILGLLQFPMMFLSGVLFPVEQMPMPLQVVSKFLPLTYAVNALRKVMILGVGIEGIVFELIVLVILCGVTVFAGIPLFDRAVRK